MTKYLPPPASTSSDKPLERPHELADMADLRVFWGSEICRLEYLVHLLETGRVKDETWPGSPIRLRFGSIGAG